MRARRPLGVMKLPIIAGTLLLLGTLTTVVSGVSAQHANAAESTDLAWSHMITESSNLSQLLTSGTDLAAASCMRSDSQAATMYAANGTIEGSVSSLQQQFNGCGNRFTPTGGPVVDRDGNVFLDGGGGDPKFGAHNPEIYSFTSAGVSRWEQPAILPPICSGDTNYRFMASWKIGADGNLYGIEQLPVGSSLCDGQGDLTWRLVSFDNETGALRFSVPIPVYRNEDEVFASENGLLVFEQDGVHYFDYSGIEASAEPYVAGSNSPIVTSAAATADGRGLTLTTTTCASNGAAVGLDGIDAYTDVSHLWHANLDNCAIHASIYAAPDGGAVLYSEVGQGFGPNGYTSIDTVVQSFDGSGSLRWTVTLPEEDTVSDLTFDTTSDVVEGVDLSGNVVIRREYVSNDNPSIAQIRLVVLDGATGAADATEDSADVTNLSVSEQGDNVGMGDGRLYAAWLSDCISGVPCEISASIYAFNVPGVRLDYPRSVLLGATASPPPPVDKPCGNAAFIGVRGSGDNNHGNSYAGRHALSLASTLEDQYHIQLDTGDVIGLKYPAVSVSNPSAVHYGSSVNTGVKNLLGDIAAIRKSCGSQLPIILAGYSQGAHVVQSTLDRLDDQAKKGDTTWQSIAAVVLLASPRFNPNDSSARGTFVADYPDGGLAGRALVRTRFSSVARTYCLNKDPFCGAGVEHRSVGVHTTGYNPGTVTGAPILADAAGLLAWGVSSQLGSDVQPNDTGELSAYRVNPLNRVRVSAGTIYADGSPTTTFDWDFTSNGSVDEVTSQPWVAHSYGIALRGKKQIETTVTVHNADGATATRQICIRQAASGTVMC